MKSLLDDIARAKPSPQEQQDAAALAFKEIYARSYSGMRAAFADKADAGVDAVNGNKGDYHGP